MIADSVVKVFTFASEAVDRCLKLTEGWGLTGLIKAIREVYPCSQYVIITMQHSHIVQLNFSLHLHEKFSRWLLYYIWMLKSSSLILIQGLFSQYLSKLSTCMHQLRRVSGLEAGGRGDEWTLLSHAFRLIQCCGMLCSYYLQLDLWNILSFSAVLCLQVRCYFILIL